MKNYWYKIKLSRLLGIALLTSLICLQLLQSRISQARNVPTWAASTSKFTPPPTPPDRKTSGTRGNSATKFIPPQPPPDRGTTGTRGNSASRGCDANGQTLMALVPAYEPKVGLTQVWGLTYAERPNLLFFVPYQNTVIANMEFVLQKQINNKSQTIYRTSLTSISPGIINVSLPETLAPLEPETMYHWFLKVRVKCNLEGTSQISSNQLDYVEGWIQRAKNNPTLTELIQQAKPQQKPTIYAEQGIWYDAIATLAQLRLANPQDTTLMATWTSLLNSVGLESLAKQPLTECCKANNVLN
ncbi:hypothetical protein NIES4101_62730 [Calothrix sp. NIES-4101]|nr:hypothetical protein NIES4101_62730 [Calothrix sp. NIES-4101]